MSYCKCTFCNLQLLNWAHWQGTPECNWWLLFTRLTPARPVSTETCKQRKSKQITGRIFNVLHKTHSFRLYRNIASGTEKSSRRECINHAWNQNSRRELPYSFLTPSQIIILSRKTTVDKASQGFGGLGWTLGKLLLLPKTPFKNFMTK